MKLIKLLYLIDREALDRWGRPVSTDRYVSMDHGPVLSSVLDLISHGAEPGMKSAWLELISAPDGYDVRLHSDKPPADDELSKAEKELIDEVFARFRMASRWDLVRYLHKTAPEWQAPQGSSHPISYEGHLQGSWQERRRGPRARRRIGERQQHRSASASEPMRRGDTFLMAAGPQGSLHLWIIATEPVNDRAVIVSVTTLRHNG